MCQVNWKPPRAYERISSDLITDNRLTEADLQILLELEMKAGESRLAKVTISWLQERTGRSRRTIFYSLAKAQRLGYVKRREVDDRGRLHLSLRETAASWVRAYRWLMQHPDWKFWQKHAFLVILAQHRAGGDHSVRYYGKAVDGIINLCHLRRYSGGDWKKARGMLDEFIHELHRKFLIGTAAKATGARPAICAVSRFRMKMMASGEYLGDTLPLQTAEGVSARGAELQSARGADVVGKEQVLSLPPDNRDFIPSLATGRGYAGKNGVAGTSPSATKSISPASSLPSVGSGTVQEARRSSAGSQPHRRALEKQKTASTPVHFPATSPATSAGDSDFHEVVQFLKDIEARCKFERSRTLDWYGEEAGYDYLACQFLQLGLAEGWTPDDLVSAFKTVFRGLKLSWAKILLTKSTDGEGSSHYRFRGRLAEAVKKSVQRRLQLEEVRRQNLPEHQFPKLAARPFRANQCGDYPQDTLGRLAWKMFPSRAGLVMREDEHWVGSSIIVNLSRLSEAEVNMLKGEWLKCLEQKDSVKLADWEEWIQPLPQWVSPDLEALKKRLSGA